MTTSRRRNRKKPADEPARVGPVLGIDPGLERTGYAVLSDVDGPLEARVHEAGVVRMVREESLARRLAHLSQNLAALIETHQPALLTCEELYAHYRHPRTAILMGHARGVILAAAAERGVEVLPVAATHVKKVLTGSGRASKRQVQLAVTATLRLPEIPEPHDVADAIAIALCGVRLRRATGRLAAMAAEVRR